MKILVSPIVSEKSARSETKGCYVFEVGMNATKTQIKQEVKKVYGENPVSIRTIIMEGKEIRSGRTRGRRANWKKALVTLAKGKTISIHKGV